jgi:anthranilate 1,2-dioxygenase small subunit
VIRCENTAMLRDRVVAPRNANIYAKPAYRHFLSGMEWREEEGGYALSTN